jgi:hypothetical protein
VKRIAWVLVLSVAGGSGLVAVIEGCGGGSDTTTPGFCDERADCPSPGGTRHCCLAFGLGGGGSAQCQGTPCNGGDLALCKTNAECGDAGACKSVTCTDGHTFYACNTTAECK